MANPLHSLDRFGLLVSALYNKSTGMVTVIDNDTRESATVPAFSGNENVDYAPVPNGVYYISKFPWLKACYYALIRFDERIDDFVDGYPSNYDPNETMQNIRFHCRYNSDGCVTAPFDEESEEWQRVEKNYRKYQVGRAYSNWRAIVS